MNLFYRRPLALFCALFAAASVGGACLTARHLPLHLPLALFLLILSALLLAVPIFNGRFHPKLLTPILALLFAALALIQSYLSIDRKLETVSRFKDEAQSCRLEIQEVTASKSYLSSYLARVERIGETTLVVQSKITFPFDAELSVGDNIQADFYILPANEDAENAPYLLANDILATLEAADESFTVIGHTPPDPFSSALSSLRGILSDLIDVHVGGEEGHLISSLFLGKRELLGDSTVRDFRRTGTTHLLAISGMHLSVIVLFVDLLLRVFGVSKKWRCVAVLLVTFFYLALTGFALSACRAFLMCGFVYLSWLFHGEGDTVTSLFFALFFLLLISPTSVYDIGMWMSVLAVLGIVIASNFLKSFRERLRKKGMGKNKLRLVYAAVSAVCISLSAELFILFPMWLAFDELSLVALPCGLLLSPPVTAILFLTPFLFLLAWFPPVAFLLGRILYGISHMILEGVTALSRLHGITVSLGHRFFDFFVPLFSLILLILLIVKLRRKWLIPAAMGTAILSLAVFLCLLRIPSPDTVTADYLAQEDNALLAFTAGEKSVILDLSSGSYTVIGRARTLLAERCSTEISAFVLTHYHQNHIRSISRLLANTTVRALYLPLPQTQTEGGILEALITEAERQDCKVTLYDRGKPLTLGELTLEVSREVYLKRSTHPTFYLSASAHSQTLIYAAESVHEDEALYAELCSQTEDAEVLILGNHGPITKESFSYPLGNGYVLLADSTLAEHLGLTEPPKGKILIDTTRFTYCLQK